MRRVITVFVALLVAITVLTPAAQAGASAPRVGKERAGGFWWQHLLAGIWATIGGARSTPPIGAPATAPLSDSDHGPDMDPNGFSAPKSGPDLGPGMDPDGLQAATSDPDHGPTMDPNG
jgi:hypothetical protein